jgi:hypothetical protein
MVLSGIWRVAWWVVDRIEYAGYAMRFAMFDWLHGPEPPTGADRKRERDRKRLRKRFLSSTQKGMAREARPRYRFPGAARH